MTPGSGSGARRYYEPRLKAAERFGIEAIIVLRDICGVGGESAGAVILSMANKPFSIAR
jgi:hypothetical protein